MMDSRAKRAAVATIKEAFDIAEKLYKTDRELYKPLFAWINAQARRHVSPALVLETLKALDRQHQSGHKPREIHEYLNGIARSIKEHKAARDLRAGQTNWISEILGRAMAAATSMQQITERFTFTRQVSGITPKGFWLGHGAPKWSSDRDVFIARKVILDCDTELDEVEIGEEITVEIPLWLARKKELSK